MMKKNFLVPSIRFQNQLLLVLSELIVSKFSSFYQLIKMSSDKIIKVFAFDFNYVLNFTKKFDTKLEQDVNVTETDKKIIKDEEDMNSPNHFKIRYEKYI